LKKLGAAAFALSYPYFLQYRKQGEKKPPPTHAWRFVSPSRPMTAKKTETETETEEENPCICEQEYR
jgi:hypothetical protein